MKSAFLAVVIAGLVCVLVATPAARAQGVGTSGKINGTVIDPTGAIMPKTIVFAMEADRGSYFRRTDTNG